MVKKQPPGNPARNLRGSPRPGQQQQQQQQQHQHQHPPASLFTERLSLATQQRTLDLFAATFQDVLTSPAFGTTLQAIKKALFERAFARAFQQPEFLSVYAARWSPTRALCYAAVLFGIDPFLARILYEAPIPASPEMDMMPSQEDTRATALRVVCVGGGAAELVALGAVLHEGNAGAAKGAGAVSLGRGAPLQVDVTLADSGPWAQIVAQLASALVTEPPLSKYASEAVCAANQPMIVPSLLSTEFVQQDILDLDPTGLASILQGKAGAASPPMLITLLFTLNELFTSSGIGKTTTFLLNLTSVVPLGSLLLVVDSPGSYSETVVGKQAKKYPMHWLLEKILSETHQAPVEGRWWTKLVSDDGVWFRLAETLRYPIPLENMRYQVHLYRADDATTVSTV